MTAEGTACNGAGEAPKAEFSPEKVVAASPEEKAAGEREGEDVGGPFVIVNGADSDGHSDRGSDLGKAPDEDSPSEEDDVPASNAAPAAGGDHGDAVGEVGPPAAALGASSADGGDRASDGSEGGADEGTAEPSSDCVTEVAQEEAVGEEDGGAAALASSGSEHAITGADSEVPAVDSEVEGNERAVDGSAVADAAEAVVNGEDSTEQDGDAAAMPCGHDDAVASAKSCSAAMESVVREDSKEEQSATDVAEQHELVTDGASALVENEHLCVDIKADSFVAATEPESQEDAAAESCGHDDAPSCVESGSAAVKYEVYGEDRKQEQGTAGFVEVVEQGIVDSADTQMANGHLCADTHAGSFEDSTEPENHANESKLTEVEESVEQDADGGEQDATDASQTNGHVSVALDADSCIVASESKVRSTETDGKETDHHEEEAPTTEAEVLDGALKATERNCAASVEELIGEKVGADGNGSVEGTADSSGEQEAMVMQVEGEATCGILEFEEVAKDGEEGLCDDCTVDVISSNGETEHPMDKRINEAVPSVGEPEEVITENTNQDTLQGGLAKDGVSIDTIHSNPGSDPYVESSLEHKVKAEVAAVDEITAESELKGEDALEVKRAAPEVDETEEKEVVVADEAIDLVDNDNSNQCSPSTVLESSDHVHHVQTEESRSKEISMNTAEQPVSGASLEHGTTVVDEAETNSETGNGSKEKSSDVAVDQGELVVQNVDELVVVDAAQSNPATSHESTRLDKPECISKQDNSSEIVGDSKSQEDQSEIFNASNMSDECSSRIATEGSSPINEVPHLTEEPCLPDESCNAIENGNESTKSSDAVESECVEALVPSSVATVVPAEQKDNGEHASSEWHGDHVQVVGQQKIYMIKVPKFAGDDLWDKIQAAQAHLDQLTQERDAINRRKQTQKAVCDQLREKLEAARREEREARTAHGDKKNDLNSVRSVLGKLHQANSVEEIDELILKKERTMQHETLTLKEEKLLLKEINELKAQRKQLSSTMGSKAEINEAFDQKDHIHERHKALKKDSDVLFTNLKSLEENTRKIQKSFDDERTALRKLNEEFRAANEIRQKAYTEWTELRSEPFKKNAYFFQYRDDRRAAETFRDTDELKAHCNSQIERVMEMWNSNDEFRKQYVESNKFSTLKRLGTHDGRRLGLDEDPPAIPSRRSRNIYPLSASSPEVPSLTSIPAPVLAAPAAVPAKEDSFPVLAAPQSSKRIKSKASGGSAQIENNSVAESEAEDLKQTLKEKAQLLEEQLELARKSEELARKEEELRKERAAAEKERLRMEQKAKAKEAEERKRRKAEKDKERAEFKARKEAEEREKKKAKKDKKKGTTPGDTSGVGDGHDAALATADTDSNASDNPREAEVSQPAAPKRLSRPAAAIKQLNRVQPMPAPLRNRGKRKLRQYILIAAAVLSVLALFVAGNYIPRLKAVHS